MAEISDDDRAFLERQRQAGVWLRIVATVIVVAIVGAIAWWMTSRPKKAATQSFEQTPAAKSAPAPQRPPVAAPITTPVAAPTAAATSPTGVTAHAIVMKLHADETSWVQITADGRSVMSRTLTAGETQTVEADRDVALQFGNAGFVDAQWTRGQAARLARREARHGDERERHRVFCARGGPCGPKGPPPVAPLRTHLREPFHVDGGFFAVFLRLHALQ